MNKAELTELVAKELDVSKAEAGRTIDTVLGCIITGAKTDGVAPLPGIGKLEVVTTAAVTGGKERVAPNGTKYVTKDKPAGRKFKLNVLKEGKETLV